LKKFKNACLFSAKTTSLPEATFSASLKNVRNLSILSFGLPGPCGPTSFNLFCKYVLLKHNAAAQKTSEGSKAIIIK